MTRRDVFKSLLGLLAVPAVAVGRSAPLPVASPPRPRCPALSLTTVSCVNGRMHETVWHVYAPPGVVLDVTTTGAVVV